MALPSYDSTSEVTFVGKGFLWTVFATMALTSLIIFCHAFTRSPKHREFHWVNMTINGAAAVSYFCMATGIGDVNVNGRTFLIQRYFDWVITTPLLLIDLTLLGGRSLSTVFGIVALDEIMIITGMLGELTDRPGPSWTFYTMAMVAYFPILYLLVEDYHPNYTASTFGRKAGENYRGILWFLLLIWTFYPLVWALHRVNSIGVDGALIFYGVLDVLAKPVYSSIILASEPLRGGEAERSKAGNRKAGYGTTGDAYGGSEAIETAYQRT